MLRAGRRLLRPGGHIAFYTIFISPGLSDADYRRALRLAPPGVASGKREQQELLRSAEFVKIVETDVTAAYLHTARGWLEARERHAAELRLPEGEAQFEQKQMQNRAQVKAIQEGLLRRSLFVAERPVRF